MTRAEKFKEVFGLKIDVENADCGFFDCSDIESCASCPVEYTQLWWKSKYEAPNEQKWIPVSEKLPEGKRAVLVWCPQYKNIYCAYLEKEQWWIFGAFIQIVPNEVIAWMPLPPCYDPQERSEE